MRGRGLRFAAAVAAAIALMTWATPSDAQTMSVLLRDHLKELRTVATHVSVSNRSGCEVREADIRTTLVNNLVPAGLTIGQAVAPTIGVSVITLSVMQSLCAAAVRFSFVYVDEVITPQINRDFAVFILSETTSVMSGPQYGFSAQIRARLDEFAQEFLAQWREVNAGSDFVRQAPPRITSQPPQSPTSATNIRTVQQRLSALGHYSGTIDGVSGPATRQAIQLFQRSQQLPATGDLDLDTMRRLFP